MLNFVTKTIHIRQVYINWRLKMGINMFPLKMNVAESGQVAMLSPSTFRKLLGIIHVKSYTRVRTKQQDIIQE